MFVKKSGADNSSNIAANSSNRKSGNVAANSGDTTSTDPPTEEARIYKIMEDKANEIGKASKTKKLDPAARIKGKIAIVNKKYDFTEDFYIELFTPYMDGFISDRDLGEWGIERASIATKPDEIDTLVRITCKRGRPIGTYTSPTGDQRVQAYAMVCGVDVIDYRTATVFAQKSFANNKMEKTASLSSDDKDFVVLQPYDAIEEYIKRFPRA